MQIRFEPTNIRPTTRIAATPPRALAEPATPGDTVHVSATRPSPLGALAASVRVFAARVLASLMPPMTGLTFMNAQPDTLPRAMRKAFDDQDAAAEHYAALRQIDGFGRDADRAVAAYASAVKATGNPDACRPVLDLVKHEAEPAPILEAYAMLAQSSGRGDCALQDLALARRLATKTPLAETSEHLAALRACDVNINDYYYRSSYADLEAPLTAVLGAPDVDSRKADCKLLIELAPNVTMSGATDQVLAVRGLDSSLRTPYVKLLKSRPREADVLRQALADATTTAAPAVSFSHFTDLLNASGSAQVAAEDLKQARTEASTRHLPEGEVVSLAARMRATDPGKDDYYGKFRSQQAALGHVLDAPDAQARNAALDELQGLEKACGSLDAADRHRQRLHALVCPAAEREAIAKAWPKFVAAYSNSADTLLQTLDQIDHASEASARFESAQTLFKSAGRADQGLADLTAATEISTRRKTPLTTVTSSLSRLRQADPAREDYYANYADLRATLEFVLDGGDHAGTRIDTLLSLSPGQAPSAALPLATRLQNLPADQDKALTEAQRLVKKFNNLTHIGDALDAAKTSKTPGAVVESFRRLSEATGKLEQGYIDLDACMQAASKHGCPLDQVTSIAERLRLNDPAREDYYGTFQSLTPTLDVLLSGNPSAGELSSAVDDLLKLQGKGRDASAALRHDQALRQVPCKPEERAELRAAYLDLLKKTNDDNAPLEVLTLAGKDPHPADTVRQYIRLLDACGKNDVALSDLKLCIKTSAVHGTLLSEAVSNLAPLRSKDPAREDYYGAFADATDTLEWVLSQPREAREAHVKTLGTLLTQGRTLAQALPHDKLLTSLPGGLSDRHLKSTAKYNADCDADLLKALETAGRQTDAVGTYDRFAHFLGVSRRPATALADLTLLLDTGNSEETADLISRLRQCDPAVQDGYASPAPLDAALQAVLALPDAGQRKTMAAEIAQLWSTEGDLQRAVRDMGWITQSPMARNDMRDAVRKLSEIVAHQYDAADNARTVYEKVQRNDIAENRGWLARLFFKRGPYERGVQSLLHGNQVTAAQLTVLDNVEKGRLPDEKFTKTVKRFNKMVALETSDDYYYTPDLGKMSEALAVSQMPVSWGTWSPQGKWEGFWALTQTQQSPLIAAAIWRCMASAADEAEAKARQAAFDQVAGLCDGNRTGALQAYSAVAENLQAGERIATALPQMETLLRAQEPTVAARTYRIGHGLQSLAPAVQQAAQGVLARARSGQEVDALYEAMKTPIGNEDMQARIELLAQLIAGTGATQALEGYAWLPRALKPEECELAAPLAGLVSVMLRNGAGLDEARGVLDWVRDRCKDTTVEHLPAADMLVSLSATLLMNPDIDNAKHQLISAEARALKERLGQGGGGIEVGDETVNVGGIKIPKNRG